MDHQTHSRRMIAAQTASRGLPLFAWEVAEYPRQRLCIRLANATIRLAGCITIFGGLLIGILALAALRG